MDPENLAFRRGLTEAMGYALSLLVGYMDDQDLHYDTSVMVFIVKKSNQDT